jgi:uncharacterized RDD family membrane protein YckC
MPEGAAFCAKCERPLRSPIRWGPGRNYAGFWIRLLAYLLDSVVCFLGAAIIGAPVFLLLRGPLNAASAGDTGAQMALLTGLIFVGIASVVGTWFYFSLFECSSWQATPGKRMLGLRVTDLEGGRISFGRASGRYWAKILSGIAYIGFIMIAFMDKKQGLHDLAAGTLVMRK